MQDLRAGGNRRLRLEHVAMAAAVLCLIVLVVLPICWLLIGSVKAAGGPTFKYFRSAWKRC